MEYYKYSKTLQVDPKLKQYLSKFKNIEDFRKAEEVNILFNKYELFLCNVNYFSTCQRVKVIWMRQCGKWHV